MACSAGVTTLCLSDYQISKETGFFPDTPALVKLPGEYFDAWENLMLHLPELNKAKQLRTEVGKLPEKEFSHLTLHSEAEWRRAYVVLCFIGQSYIWGEGKEAVVTKVPKKLAVPWCHVSEHLGVKPVVCFAATILYNMTWCDPQGSWDADNIRTTASFTGTGDENWFCVMPLIIELTATPFYKAVERIYDDMHHHKDSEVQACLQLVQQSVVNIRKCLPRMCEKCKPATFFNDVLPFQAGSKDLEAFPDGLLFEGVDPKPRRYHGASAAQTSIIHVIDLFLGIVHTGREKDFLEEMRLYMPEKHAGFLKRLEEMPSVREYCITSKNPDLFASYNSAVDEFAKFRTDHVILVTRYVIQQQQDTKETPVFMRFLKKVRDETNNFIIS